MSLTRQHIIAALHLHAQSHADVVAMWLEGADATGTVDAYSDIDFCFAVKAGALASVREMIQQSLMTIGVIDLQHQLTCGETKEHVIFHLAGTSPELLLDCCLYTEGGSTFYTADAIEQPLVLFDHGPVIRFISQDDCRTIQLRDERVRELQQMIAQSARIEKYVKRGNFLEAFGYYHRWLMTPLVELVRMVYTPLHPDYYIVHISRHLPADILQRLEALFKVNSVEEIEQRSREALVMVGEMISKLSESGRRESGRIE